MCDIAGLTMHWSWIVLIRNMGNGWVGKKEL